MSAADKQLNLSLSERLRQRIASEGPISFRDWMQTALYDERDGYYSHDRPRQGKTGDYRTAPETTPLFAATMANYFMTLFQDLGAPSQWTIHEAGAGSGEFAYGVLSSLRSRYPRVFPGTCYVIDESSAAARARAQQRLAEFAGQVEFERLDASAKPSGVGIVFSNELIDAFPVYRVTWHHGRLRELSVGLDRDRFVWVDSDPDPRVADYCERIDLQLKENQITEVNLEAEVYIARAATRFENSFVVTVDYGAERAELLSDEHRPQGTVRSFHRHQFAPDILAHPGEQDLTTTIDWTQIREAGERAGLETWRFEPLDRFLSNEGLLSIMTELVNTLPTVEYLALVTGAREMIMPHGMAASFQIMIQHK
jgi:SAM-dependent MidA family methyltransferase